MKYPRRSFFEKMIPGVSHKFLLLVIRPKLEISGLFSRGCFGACSEDSQWGSRQSPEKFWIFGT